MNEKLYKLNRIYAIADTLVSLAVIATFGACAYFFGKWWIGLLNLIPLALFQTHTIIIDADLEAADKGDADESSR